MSNITQVNTKKDKLALHEDWVVVILGFLIIGLSVFRFDAPIPIFSWNDKTDLLEKILSFNNILSIGSLFFYTFLIAFAGTYLTAKSLRALVILFPLLYSLTIIALVLAGNNQVKALNLEAVIFSLSIGLIVGNGFPLSESLRATLSTELFVKIGLVLLGTSVIFSDILKAGALGLIQALIVVLSVWYFAFWLCRKFKLDDDLTMMISSAVSICGVSAAIATAGVIKGDSKKLSYVISLVLVTAIPMMIFMPYVANYFHFSQEVTGAWLGGSIDTTGAVVASGSLVGEIALKISTIVKFSQNVLLGIAAFAISVYWTYSKNINDREKEETPTLKLIWDRFPKFVLGFIVASLIFSFIISPTLISNVKDSLKNLQTLWFVLAFTSIGLETKFSDMFNSDSRKPLYAFLLAQTFNIIVTLIIAHVLFG